MAYSLRRENIKTVSGSGLAGQKKEEFPATALQCACFSKNDLLAELSSDDMAILLPHLELVYVPFAKQLFEYGEKLSYVYFPTTAVIALLYLMADGGTSEIAVVGHDGLVGISALFGELALGTAVVQSAGYAYKLRVSALIEACDRTKKLRELLLSYTHVLLAQVAQNSVSSRHYCVDQQLSRWLLNRLDRLPGNVLESTQAMIANMLGVRRESITGAATRLQQEGLIRYRRGSITVLDRSGLEKRAGECYQTARQGSSPIVSRDDQCGLPVGRGGKGKCTSIAQPRPSRP